jgi:hypothetical protein
MTSTRRTAKDTATTKPVQVSAELKALMRRLKLGQLLDTLPERSPWRPPATSRTTTS